jgi:hypothetical protein
MSLFKRKKQSSQGGPVRSRKNNAGKIRRAKIKNIRKAQAKKIQSKKQVTRKRKKQPRKINWQKAGVVFLMGCFGVFTIWVLLFSDAMEIDEIDIVGYDEGKEELLQIVKESEKNKLFGQEIKRNLILFPSKTFKNSIQEKYHVVKSVEIQKAFPNKLIINITKRERVALWKQANNCQLLDEEDNIIEEFDCGNEEKELLNICSKKEEMLGLSCQVFIKTGEWKESVEKAVIKEISKTGQQILKEIKTTFYFDNDLMVIVPDIASREIRIKSENHGEIWFSTDQDLGRQLKKLRTFLERKVDANDLESMLYIDLRLDDKIIYRFKEGYDNKELIIEDE